MILEDFKRPTVCVSGWPPSWENVREQKKPEARKMLVNRAESRQSTARIVGRIHGMQSSKPEPRQHCQYDQINM